MNLSFEDFLVRLAHGQLKNTSATDEQSEGLVDPNHEEQLLTLTNQGLIDITSKKKLFEGFGVITFVDGQNIYPLDTGSGGAFENMVRVLEIVTSDGRRHTPKTNANILMPSSESLRFSNNFMKMFGPSVEVRYQMTHPPLTGITGIMSLPAHLFEALVLYVSGLYLSHMGGEQNTAKGDSYYGLYLKMMNEDSVENTSSTSELVDEDTRFQDRGFV